MTSKLKTDVLETVSGSGTIALTNQLSGMTSASVPAHSVIQIVNASTATAQASTSSTYAQYTALTATITPTSTSSKILVMFKGDVNIVLSGGSNTHMGAQIYRGTSAVSRVFEFRHYDYGGSGQYAIGNLASDHLDSPATTSATTYSIYFAHLAGTTTNMRSGDLTLMEIKG